MYLFRLKHFLQCFFVLTSLFCASLFAFCLFVFFLLFPFFCPCLSSAILQCLCFLSSHHPYSLFARCCIAKSTSLCSVFVGVSVATCMAILQVGSGLQLRSASTGTKEEDYENDAATIVQKCVSAISIKS